MGIGLRIHERVSDDTRPIGESDCTQVRLEYVVVDVLPARGVREVEMEPTGVLGFLLGISMASRTLRKIQRTSAFPAYRQHYRWRFFLSSASFPILLKAFDVSPSA